MDDLTLGQKIRQLRDKADLSLRELADKVKVTAPFLSDIELGRRYPSDDVLAKLAEHLHVSTDELKCYDVREPVADMKRLMELNPKLGFAFRSVVEDVKSGKITPEDLLNIRKPRKPPT